MPIRVHSDLQLNWAIFAPDAGCCVLSESEAPKVSF